MHLASIFADRNLLGCISTLCYIERGFHVSANKFRLMSTCAVRAGWHGTKLVCYLYFFFFMLTIFQRSPCFYVLSGQNLWTQCGKRRNCSWRVISPIPRVFSILLENIPSFSWNIEFSSASSFKLDKVIFLPFDEIYCEIKGSPPGWLSGERVWLMTWWLWVRYPVEATFFRAYFTLSPLLWSM